MEGWIKLHRQIQEWEWYDDPQTTRLFTHLLIVATHTETKWRGEVLKPGQILTGRRLLAAQTGLSEQNIRTSLERLQVTHEVTIKVTHRFSIITLNKWKDYQSSQPTDQPASQPPSNQQVTTFKNVKKVKNNIYSEEHNRWLNKFNQIYETKYRGNGTLNNFTFWRGFYSFKDIVGSLPWIFKHNWLEDKATPSMILRRRDRSGQSVDRIGELLTLKNKEDNKYYTGEK